MPGNQAVPLGVDTLSADKPWMLFLKSDHLWLADLTGGLKDLGEATTTSPVDLADVVSRSGKYAALLTWPTGGSLAATVYAIPSGSIQCRLESLPANDNSISGALVLSRADSIAWSPVRDVLAIAAPLDGVSSDVYLIDPVACQPKRLTSGELDAFDLRWSPDGRYVVHTAGTLGGYEGDLLDALWASAADGSGNKYLYAAPRGDDASGSHGSIGEIIHGWLSSTAFIVSSDYGPFDSAVSGARDLRSFDIETGESTMLWPDKVAQVAFDPAAKSILLHKEGDFTDEPLLPNAAGVYLIRPGYPPQVVYEEGVPAAYLRIAWHDGPRLFVVGGLVVTPSGETRELTSPDPECRDPLPSPDGRYWAWNCPDVPVIVGADTVTRVPSGGAATQFSWSPDGDSLYFFAGSGSQSLYRYSRDDGALRVIAEGFHETMMFPESPVWIR